MADKKNSFVGKAVPVKKGKMGDGGRRVRRIVALILFVFVSVFGAGVAIAFMKIADWGAEHQIIRQRVVELTVRSPIRIEEREPEIIVPVIEEEPELDDLSEIERKIYEAFGARNFTVMRAVAKCESGMNPEAVNWATRDLGLFQINWTTWENPVREEFGYTLSDMFDVDKNIEVARWIWDRDGDGDGNVHPWVATSTKCFKDEL